MSSSTRPPLQPCPDEIVSFVGHDEQRDAAAFARALQPPTPLLQHVTPAVNPYPGALDLLLFRGVLLVAYTARSEVIIARGSDLATLRRLRCVQSPLPFARAVAFRSSDGALAAAFGDRIVVFSGWRNNKSNTTPDHYYYLYSSRATETVIQGFTAHILSWSRDGTKLAAVGEGVAVWTTTTTSSSDHPDAADSSSSGTPEYKRIFEISPAQMPLTSSFDLGSISPDGSLIVASALYSRLSWVWALPSSSSSSFPDLPPATISHGYTGVAALDWKPRGGGNPALMTVDRDGTVRLWVKIPKGQSISSSNTKRQGVCIEEVARCPHAERTKRAGASFLRWGGGGCAEDEVDARATGATSDYFLGSVAPKPSRCVHWILRVAGGNAQAWRVRGLDDRPRAEYARLEPGSGDALHGAENIFFDDGIISASDGRPSLKDVSIIATRSVAPIPLTASSQRKAGLVRSYAISNGERLLRSPEPPNPPNVGAVFVLLVRNGNVVIARYDVCPTSNAAAVCRARIGAGHSSPVAGLVVSQKNVSARDSRGWLATRGFNGDVLIWRTDVAAGASEPISVTGRLSGPHTAVAFAPQSLVSDNSDALGVLAVDAAFGNLRLFIVKAPEGWRNRRAIQNVEMASMVSTCFDSRSSDPTVNHLYTLPLSPDPVKSVGSHDCVVFGLTERGHVYAWRVSYVTEMDFRISTAKLVIEGRRMGCATAAATCVEGGNRTGLIAVGGDEGCIRLYAVSSVVNGNGEINLKEIAFLGEKDGSEATVSGIDISVGGARITATRSDGSITVWERSTVAEGKWIVVLSHNTSNGKEEICAADVCTGLDRSGSPCLLSRSPSGELSMFHKPLGTCWEHSGTLSSAARAQDVSTSAIAFIGPGFAVAASGCGLTLYDIKSGRKRSTSFGADAAGYSPTRSLLPFLFLGGEVDQVRVILSKLSESIILASRKTISSSTYGAGRGLVPPPPALKIILEDANTTQDQSRNDVLPAQEFSIPSIDVPGQSLFAALMARSDVKGDEEHAPPDATLNSSSKDPMLTLTSRLRVVSLAGITREEQNVLQALAKSLAKLKDILPSLDPSGARFALFAECYKELMPNSFIPTPIVAFALHSTSSDALMDYFLPKPQALSLGAQRLVGLKSSMGNASANSYWDNARKIGAGWWLATTSNAKKLIERIARSEFNRTRNAEYAALWYVALGRNSAVAALFKAQQDIRMAQFFLRNFSSPENRIAASKNAYVLVSKHRLILATAFFILANNITGALNLVKSRMKDLQLYILLARVLANGEHLQSCLTTVCESMAEVNDSHTQAMALWLQGKHEKSMAVAGKAESIGNEDNALSKSDRSFVLGIPTAVFTLGHVLVMSERPPVRGLDSTFAELQSCRWKAVQALQVDESPFATLKATFDLIKFTSQKRTPSENGVLDDFRLSTPLEYLRSIHAVSAAADSIKGRAVAFSGAARSEVTKKSLLRLVETDLTDLANSSCLGYEGTVDAAVAATDALIRADEVDAAIATILATISVATKSKIQALYRKAEFGLEYCLRLSVSRALSHVQCAVSLLHQQSTTFNDLREVWNKTQSALLVLSESKFVTSSFDGLVREFKGTELALRFGIGFIDGDWTRILVALKSCESLWPTSVAGITTKNSAPSLGDFDEPNSCSNVSADMVSVEALRHMASNPAVLGISPGLGHRRRKRRAPSMCLIENHGGVSAATLPDEARGMPSLSVVANDPFALIRIHPALSSTLCASALAYLATHLASSAAKFEKRFFRARLSGLRNGLAETKSMSGFRLVDAAEELEHVANDAIAGWIPLPPFGIQAQHKSMSHPDVAAGAFVDLWTTLGCLPEYAPSLSEAATVAAAELAAAASHAAVEAAEKKDGGRRMRKRRERKGEIVADVSKEGLQHLDTTSDVALHGAYPVRFSSSATGPWSGRGRHATLYKESGALFRKLCVSCTDPPAVIVATPKGIQEIVPSSYTTMPAGFRSHYLTQAQKRNKRTEEQRQHAFEQEKKRDQRAKDRALDDEIISSFNAGFGEGPYLPLSMSKSNSPKIPSHRSALSGNKNAVWRHQVEATALAAHPFRRRFASGGTDGLVRLWDFADPLCLASLREDRYGRVSSISFSAYGDRVMGVYSSGHVAIWDDPDNYRSIDVNISASRRRKARIITAFDNRCATDGIFVDERHTIAVVGDPMAPPVVGASLRVFDTREPNSSFHASWSAQVHDHGESRCIALLEDRVRIVCGGLNGSLSVVDLRTKGCIAELPAHPDEVTCLAVEWPRGRAIVSGCRNGDVKVWDSRTLLQLDVLKGAHSQTRHYWSGSGLGGLVGSYGTESLALTNRSLISCGGDGVVKIWGPGWSDYDLNVL